MKRVFQHPPDPLTGKKYWRSLGEYSKTPEFREWLEREFPAGASEISEDEWSRRDFMKLMSASMALAGLGLTSCRRPQMHLVPFTKSAEWTIPGKFLYYATAMPRRTGAIPLIASTVDGRPIKLEGNPLHPASAGATDAFAQASVLDLYDPARSRRFVNRVKDATRAEFDAYIEKLRGQIGGGEGLAFLVEEVHSPTRERLRADLEKAFPKMMWCVYDAALSEAQNFATRTGFGENVRLIPRFDRADIVFALDSDFLDCGEGDLAGARAFTQRRRVKSSKDTMNRLYVVENRFTITGAMADHRLRCAASQIPAFAYALAGKIADATKDPGLSSVLGALTSAAQSGAEFDDEWLTEAAKDLISKSGVSIVLAGSHQPVVVQLLAYAMNSALKNIGRTVVVREFPRNKNTKSILQLADRMNRGEIKQLFIFGGDPVYNAPRAVAQDQEKKAPLDWVDLQKKVPEVVRLGYHEDATSTISQWHVPLAHYLESWGDALTSDGAYLSIQPMILPLFGGFWENAILNTLPRPAENERPEGVPGKFRTTKPPADLPAAWSKFLRDGFAAHVPLRDRPVSFNGGAAAS